mgnify:CR=1 FL=1
MEKTNLLAFLEQRSKTLENHIALGIRSNLGWNELTFKGLSILSRRLASYLIEIGINKGDKVAILSESMPELGATLFANILAGAISVPLDIKLTIHELQHILSDCLPRVILVSSAHLDDAVKLKEIIPSIEHIIIIDGKGANTDYINLHTLDNMPERKWRHRGFDKTALIVYTSGTTGNPKGVETTYKNIFSQVQAVGECFSFDSNDAMLSILPMNHLFEISVGFMTFLNKGAAIYYSNSLKPKDILPVMQEKKITFMVAVPAFLKLMKNTLEAQIKQYPKFKKMLFDLKYALCSILKNHTISKIMFRELRAQFGGKFKGFMSGGAPLDMNVALFFENIGIPIYEAYGLTESSPITTMNSEKHRKLGSVGRPIKNIEVKLDKDTHELLIRGENIMKGYYNKPELTKETITPDGWLKTGDIARIDSSGYVYITGRIKNMIVLSGGKKVFPEEVEAVMVKSPMIEEIVVYSDIIKTGSKQGSEEIVAKIHPTREILDKYEDDSELEKVIRAEVKKLSQELSSYKRPNTILISRTPLPRTGISKVSRKQVKQMQTA